MKHEIEWDETLPVYGKYRGDFMEIKLIRTTGKWRAASDTVQEVVYKPTRALAISAITEKIDELLEEVPND